MATPEQIEAARAAKIAQERQENKEKENPLATQVAAMAETVNQLVALSKLDVETKQKEVEKEAALKVQKEQEQIEDDTDFQKLLRDSENKEEEKGFNDLTNNELLDVVSDAFNKTLDARMKVAKSSFMGQLAKVGESGDAVKKAVLGLIAKSNVEKVISDNADFGEFQKETKAVMQKYPGIDVQDAFTLAKAQKIGALPPKQELETERPDSSMAPLNTSRFEDRENKGHKANRGNEYAGDRAHGIADFRQFAEVGVEKALAKRNMT